ncbi:uncharacterized protein LOC106170377 [Lingula anatina]|uniref:Uncharacterized protein LOC106170377 n=1 Tax=Lingula anatina TaxID=7574 RepID=A0A1S3J601_LINAN|nr:uncharacterized protein LOC106170377 [Lingula anatina]|eukprot:XP_013405676.1 uncharacterized protein LOC106170377 [Lingula anatina]
MENLKKKFSPTKHTATQSRSTFHTPLKTFQYDVQDFGLHAKDFIGSLSRFSGTGSLLALKALELFNGTAYSETAGQFQSALEDVNMATQAVTNEVRQEVDTLIQRLVNRLEPSKDDRSEDNLKLLAQCFVAVVRLQCQFFFSVTETFSQFSSIKDVEDILPVPKRPPRSLDKLKAADQSKLTTQKDSQSKEKSEDKGAQKAAGETKDKAGTSHDSKSAANQKAGPSVLQNMSSVPVNLPVEKTSQSSAAPIPKSHPLPALQTSSSLETASTPSNEDGPGAAAACLKLSRSQSVPPPNGHTVSQEVLDSVIDFLSGIRKPPMQSIPEISLQGEGHEDDGMDPSSGGGSSSGTTPSTMNMSTSSSAEFQYTNPGPHRHSDAGLQFLDLPLDSSRGNTWPSTMHHRGSYPSDLMMAANQQMYLPGYAAAYTPELEYSQYMALVSQAGQDGQYLLGPGWGAGDAKLNRSWPPSWSGAQDDSSDEDSSIEEQVALGTDLMNAVNDKRRHSSGEHKFSDGTPLLHGAGAEARPRSVDDLHMESRSTNTWPPKQVWTRPVSADQVADLSSSTYASQAADAVQPQMSWSDVVGSSRQSPWGTGLPSTQYMHPASLQQTYSSVPPGGSRGSAQGAAQADAGVAKQQVERKQSVTNVSS